MPDEATLAKVDEVLNLYNCMTKDEDTHDATLSDVCKCLAVIAIALNDIRDQLIEMRRR